MDEVTEPRLHPVDPLDRAYNRAWNDYVPTFSAISHLNNAEDEEDLRRRCVVADGYFSKLEGFLNYYYRCKRKIFRMWVFFL